MFDWLFDWQYQREVLQNQRALQDAAAECQRKFYEQNRMNFAQGSKFYAHDGKNSGFVIDGECRHVEDEDNRPFVIGVDFGNEVDNGCYCEMRKNEDGSLELVSIVERL